MNGAWNVTLRLLGGRSVAAGTVAYLSRSAGTLRRDLETLAGSNYRVERITPYDFFPQTYHVETLVLLQEA